MSAAQLTNDSPSRPSLPRLRLGRGSELLPLIAALMVMVAFFRIASPYFLTARNVTNLLAQVAPLAIVAAAASIVIIMGEIDLSLGSVAGFTGALVAILLSHPSLPWTLAVLATLAAGFAVAGLHGLIVLGGGVQSFAVTLAGYFVWFGVQVGILGHQAQEPLRRAPVSDLASARISSGLALTVTALVGAVLIAGRFVMHRRDTHESRLSRRALCVSTLAWLVVLALVLWGIRYLESGGGLPLVFVVALAIVAVVWLVLTRTAYGRHVYAVGGDAAATRAMGIPVARVKWVTFAAAGVMAAVGGIAIVSYTGGADTSTGAGAFILQAVGAAVVGGISLLGGRGSVWGAFGGAVLLAGVQNGLALLSLDFYVVDIALGGVVLAALFADGQIRRRLVSR